MIKPSALCNTIEEVYITTHYIDSVDSATRDFPASYPMTRTQRCHTKSRGNAIPLAWPLYDVGSRQNSPDLAIGKASVE